MGICTHYARPRKEVGTLASRNAQPIAGWLRSFPITPRRARTVAAAVLLAIALLAGILSTGETDAPHAHNILVYDTAQNRIIRMDETAHTFALSDQYASSMQVSLDHSAAAILMEEDAWYAGTLYYLTAKTNIRVDDNVYQFVLADSGKGIAYIRDIDREAGTGDLYLFDGNKRQHIAADVYRDSVQISPDGKSVAYASGVTQDTLSFTGYKAINGKKPVPIGPNRMPLALSNGGKYVYMLHMDPSAGGAADLYLARGRKQTLLRPRIGENASDFHMILNRDYSQAIINDGGRSWLSIKGAEPEPVGRYPLRAIVTDSRIPGQTTNYGLVTVYHLDDLRQVAYFNASNDVVYLGRSGESTVIQRSSKLAYPVDVHLYFDGFGFNRTTFVDEAQTTLLYLDDRRRLFRQSLTDPKQSEQLLADNVHSFVASADIRHIYFLDDRETLYYLGRSAPKSAPKQLHTDVDRMKLVTSPDGATVYFLTDDRQGAGTLHASTKGRKPRKIADDVYDLFSTPLGIGYAQHHNGQSFVLHFSTGGKSFTRIDDDVRRLRHPN